MRSDLYGQFAPFVGKNPEQVLLDAHEGQGEAAEALMNSTTRIVDWTSILERSVVEAAYRRGQDIIDQTGPYLAAIMSANQTLEMRLIAQNADLQTLKAGIEGLASPWWAKPGPWLFALLMSLLILTQMRRSS